MSPQFGVAFRYFVQKRNGFNNLLLVTVCNLIPVVGPIVALGYRSEVSEALDADPDLLRHPDFKFERFVEYLTRGVWPFLVALVVSLVFYVPMLLIVFGVIVAMAAAKAPPVIVISVMVGCSIVVAFLLTALLMPMTLHAELTAKFDLRGAYRFAIDFWKLVPGPTILTGVIFFPLSILVAILGLLCFIVGIYPASVISQMAGQHLMMQLYREYVDRGGEPLLDYDPEPEEGSDDRGNDDERDT